MRVRRRRVAEPTDTVVTAHAPSMHQCAGTRVDDD